MRAAGRPLLRYGALSLGILLLALVVFRQRTASQRSAGPSECSRPEPVRGGELLWESLSRGLGSAVSL